jgi:Co/Zn/Cd efflux system component
LLDWLESSAVARIVQESIWGYPIVLSAHAIGMAILVGIVLMINFRILGFAPRIPVSSLRIMFKVALLGLVVNVVSGTMLFVANADAFYESNPFRIKVVLLVTGSALLVVLARRVFGPTAAGRSDAIESSTRIMAAASVLVWLGVIVAGRLIAYWDWSYF